jgi:hypothetical protein
MRKAYQNSHIIEDNGIFYGISLGYDFCAEHEWGIKDLQSKLGIDTKKMGIDGRTITKDITKFIVEGKNALLITTGYWNDQLPALNDNLPRCLHISKDPDDLQTAWDGGSFGVLVRGDKNVKYLKELKEAFEKNDVAIAFMRGVKPNPFENSSLSLVIKSRLPEEMIQQMYDVDKKAFDLLEYEKEIGVTELKDKRAKKFMACSPRWIDYEDAVARKERKKELGTKYDIQFWVNYSDDDNNYGWYIAEDIIKWLSTPGITLKSLNKTK